MLRLGKDIFSYMLFKKNQIRTAFKVWDSLTRADYFSGCRDTVLEYIAYFLTSSCSNFVTLLPQISTIQQLHPEHYLYLYDKSSVNYSINTLTVFKPTKTNSNHNHTHKSNHMNITAARLKPCISILFFRN